MPDRRPKHERDDIYAIMEELNVSYTTALREYERRAAAHIAEAERKLDAEREQE